MRDGDPELDAIDLHLLRLLQEDGRASNQALADEVGLSPSACLRRVRRLEDAGVVLGYTAVLAPSVTGAARTVVVEVSLTSQHEDALSAFELAAREVPGLRSCHLLAGDADYLIVLGVRDVDAYEVIHREHLARLPHVARLRSSVALRTVVDRAAPHVRR